MSLEDVRGLCNWNSNDEYTNCPNYIWETTYWLGTASESGSYIVDIAAFVTSPGEARYDSNNFIGSTPF